MRSAVKSSSREILPNTDSPVKKNIEWLFKAIPYIPQKPPPPPIANFAKMTFAKTKTTFAKTKTTLTFNIHPHHDHYQYQYLAYGQGHNHCHNHDQGHGHSHIFDPYISPG